MKRVLSMVGLLLMPAAVVGCGNVEPKEADHAGNTAVTNDGSDKPEGARDGKPSAPVVIDGKVEATTAKLGVGFVSEATEVNIEVWGVDGLVVTNSVLTRGGQALTLPSRFGKGEHVEVEVSFTAPTTVQTNLAIRVRGSFGGTVRERVQSFTVNGHLPAATKAPGEVKTGPDGTPVRVMKAQ